MLGQVVANFGIAAVSKLVGTVLVCPLAVMKTKMQIVGSSENAGVIKCAKGIVENDGYRGFYKGLLPTILRDVPYTAIQYSIYKSCLHTIGFVVQEPNLNTGIVAACAGTGSVIAILISYPFDNMRIRQQAASKGTF